MSIQKTSNPGASNNCATRSVSQTSLFYHHHRGEHPLIHEPHKSTPMPQFKFGRKASTTQPPPSPTTPNPFSTPQPTPAGGTKTQTVSPTKTKRFSVFRGSSRSKNTFNLEDSKSGTPSSKTHTPKTSSLANLFLSRSASPRRIQSQSPGTGRQDAAALILLSSDHHASESGSDSLEKPEPEASNTSFDFDTPSPTSASAASSLKKRDSKASLTAQTNVKQEEEIEHEHVTPIPPLAVVIQPPTPVLPSFDAAVMNRVPSVPYEPKVPEIEEAIEDDPTGDTSVELEVEHRDQFASRSPEPGLQQYAEILQRTARRIREDGTITQRTAFRTSAPLIAFLYVLAVGVLLPRGYVPTSIPMVVSEGWHRVPVMLVLGMALVLAILRAGIWVASRVGETLCEVDMQEVFSKGSCVDAQGIRMGEGDMIVGGLIG